MASSNIWMKSLKWINHKDSLVEVLSNVRSRDAFCDASISCDGKFYSVHKLVMSACSDYLRELFEKVTQFTSNTTYPVIILNEIQHQHLENLLDLIYLGTVDVEQSELPNLIKVAKSLQFKGLNIANEFSEAASSTHNIEEETIETEEWSRYDAENDSFNANDDSNDPLALDSHPGTDGTLASQEKDLNISRLHSPQLQRAGCRKDRYKKWQPGGRGRPPKNISYRNVNPGINQYTSYEASVSTLNAEDTNNSNSETSLVNARDTEVQSTNIRHIECPICHRYFPFDKIEAHASSCNEINSKPTLRTFRLPVNKINETKNRETPLDGSKQPDKVYMKKGSNLIPRKKKRRKGILFTPQSAIRKRKEYLKNYHANKRLLKDASKVSENNSVKVSKNISKKSKLMACDNGISKANDKRPLIVNAVIPKVKRPVGRPPKIKKNMEKQIKVKKVSALVDSTSTRTEESNNTEAGMSSGPLFVQPLTAEEEAAHASMSASNPGNAQFRRPPTTDPNVLRDSFHTEYEWHELPDESGNLQSIRIKKEKTDLQSSEYSNEQFDDIIIKEEPDEDTMFRIESVTTLNTNTAEARIDRSLDDSADENVHVDVNKLNDEVVKPFGSRIKRCRRCAGCKIKVNCGKCESCNSGVDAKYIRCHSRICKKLKRIKEKRSRNVNRIKIDNLVTTQPTSGVEDISGTAIKKSNYTLACRICNKQFHGKNSKFMLYRHGLGHKKHQRYACTSCNYSSHWLWQIKAHKEKKHKNAPVNVIDKSAPVNVIGTKGNRPRIQCPQCPFSCIQKTYMKKHLLKFHKEDHLENKNFGLQTTNTTVSIQRKPKHSFTCNTCGKLFEGPNKIRQFKLHNYYHKRRKMFPCSYCSFHCDRKAFLDAHMKKNHKAAILLPQVSLPQIKIERLPEEVLKATKPVKILKTSDKILKEENKNRTEEQKLKNLTALNGPEAWLETENGKCLLCDRMFKFKSQFTTHWRSHSAEKPFKCPYCSFCCNHKCNLNYHISKYHKTGNKLPKMFL